MLGNLERKITKSKKIISEALEKFEKDKTAIAWTGGKDSTIVLHLVREIEKGKVPIKVFSLGEAPFTKPVRDRGSERSGREKDKEEIMRRLRALGYW